MSETPRPARRRRRHITTGSIRPGPARWWTIGFAVLGVALIAAALLVRVVHGAGGWVHTLAAVGGSSLFCAGFLWFRLADR